MDKQPPDSHPSRPPSVSELEALQSSRFQVDEILAMSAASDPRRWAATLSTALAELAVAFERHRDQSEAPGGTLEELVSAHPELNRAARRVRNEHPELIADIEALRREAHVSSSADDVDVDRLRWKGSSLLDALRRHIARGSDLLHESFFRDSGGES